MTSGTLFAEPQQAAVVRPRERLAFWGGLAAALAFGMAVGMAVSWPLFSGNGMVPDDARQFVFWMYRWADPGLFPGDPIADYFQAMSPHFYTALYRGAFALGIDPIVTNRLLPLGLTAVTTVVLYLLTVRLCSMPLAGLLATAFVNVELWMKDDLTSGTPRAFFVPLMTLFLYALARRNLVLVALAVVLMGGIYPAALLVALATLGVWLVILLFQHRADRQDWMLVIGTGLVGVAVLLPFALTSNAWGPVIPAELARTWTEFQEWGRTRFFFSDPWVYWVCSPRSGLEPVEWCRYLNEEETRAGFEVVSLLLLTTALAVPFAIPLMVPRATDDGTDMVVLPAFLLGSLACFLLAHALLFELHLPSRYVQHSLRMLAGIGFGIGTATLIRALGGGYGRRRWLAAAAAAPLAILLPTAVLTAPLFGKDTAFNVKYQIAEPRGLYEYLALQPPDILVASLTRQTDDVPLYARRSVLFSHEHSIPYHLGYYAPMREAIIGYIRALYADDLGAMQRFIRDHGVSHLIVHRAAFSPAYVRASWWTKQFPDEAAKVLDRLKTGPLPVFAEAGNACIRGGYDDLLVIGAGCLLTLDPGAWRATPANE